jgi:hypothetical protein
MNKRNAIISVAATAIVTAGLMGGLAVAAGSDGTGPSAMVPGFMQAHARDRQESGRRQERGGSSMMSRICDPRRDAVLAAGVAFVETTLELTPEQTTAWQDLTTKLTAGSEKIGENCAALTQDSQPGTSLDKLVNLEQGLSSALAIVQDVRPAYDAFYGTLTAEQQKSLEALMPKRGFGKRRGKGDSAGRGGEYGERHGMFHHDDDDEDDDKS